MARGRQIVATIDEVLELENDQTGYIGFPPFHQPHFEAPYVLTIQLETQEDVDAFVDLLGDEYSSLLEDGKRSVKSYWYPPLDRGERGGGNQYVWVEVDEEREEGTL